MQSTFCRRMQAPRLLLQSQSPCELFLGDSMDHVLLVSFIYSDSYNLSFPFLWVPHYPSEGSNIDHQFRQCLISDCGSLHPLSSALGGSLFYADWSRNWFYFSGVSLLWFLVIYVLWGRCPLKMAQSLNEKLTNQNYKKVKIK